MNSTEARLRRIESLLKKLIDAFNTIVDKLKKMAEDQARASRPNPNNQGGGGWTGYTIMTIPMRMTNNFGQVLDSNGKPVMSVKLVKPGRPPVETGVIISPFNFTGGTIPANVYVGGSIDEGEYVLKAQDCNPGTFNGSPGTSPPQPKAAIQTQTGQTMTTENGQTFVS